MSRSIGQCETCGADAPVLNQSYAGGAMECDTCALNDPFMSREQRDGIKRRIAKRDQARVNFHQEAKAA